MSKLLNVFRLLVFWTVKWWHLDPPVTVLLNIITDVIRNVLLIAPETLQYLTCNGVRLSLRVPVILPTVLECVFTLSTWSTPSCVNVRPVPLPVWLTSRPPLFSSVIWTAMVVLCNLSSYRLSFVSCDGLTGMTILWGIGVTGVSRLVCFARLRCLPCLPAVRVWVTVLAVAMARAELTVPCRLAMMAELEMVVSLFAALEHIRATRLVTNLVLSILLICLIS